MKHMMAMYKLFFFVVVSLGCYACSSDIQKEDKNVLNHSAGSFLVTQIEGSSFNENSRSYENLTTVESDNVKASVEESDWILSSVDTRSRNVISGNEVHWPNSPDIALFISETSGNLLQRNIPYNPYNGFIYDKYISETNNEYNGAQNNHASVESSNFFWDTWSKKENMSERVDFYGCYPRPRDGSGNLLGYQKVSILSREDVNGQVQGKEWYNLDYVFEAEQTDENMSWHDVMYSIPEESHEHRYGNKGKDKDSNIQMHFTHAFSLLDIEVNRGEQYVGDCEISSIEISGTQVFPQGTLNIKTGEITPMKVSEIGTVKRRVTPTDIAVGKPFNTTVIVQPTQDAPTEDNEDEQRLFINCVIDGVNYKCSFPTLSLAAGKKYKIRLTLKPQGAIVFRIWDGATVNVGSKELDSGEQPLESGIAKENSQFTVRAAEGYKIIKVFKNGQIHNKSSDGSYTLDRDDSKNTYYNIVTCLDDNWYITDDMRLQFDAVRNVYFKDIQDTKSDIWYDLSGNDNNGTLRSFNKTETSGWDNNGLVFDGIDDIVTYPGALKTSAYTMELYVCIDKKQKGAFPRLTAEGPYYPSLFIPGTADRFNGTVTTDNPTYTLQFYDKRNSGSMFTMPAGTAIQIDLVYDGEKVLFYLNGGENSKKDYGKYNDPEQVAIASLGNRIQDNTRALKATYYSFILYDKALDETAIKQNYEVNKNRFGK